MNAISSLSVFRGATNVDYHAWRLLHRGQFSEVFAARHVLAPDCEIIVKCFHAPGDVTGLDEARMLVQLAPTAPVAPLLDVGWRSDHIFLVLDRVDGVDLAALSRVAERFGVRISGRAALELAASAARAAHAMHTAHDDRGLPLEAIHGQLAPEHIMVTCRGRITLLDLGGVD